MKRLLLILVVVIAGDGILLAQRQGGPAPQGRGGAGVAGRQGGPEAGGRQGAPPRPARDRAQAEGTAVIRGRVLTADSGTPLRRAEVQASLGGQRSRTVLTDADGRFELRGLAAGSWVVRASKTGFVAQQYGQRAPAAPTDPVVLADAQQFTANFALLRGGVITGRVFDEGGDPIANVRVTALRAQLTPGGRRMVGAGGGLGMTDDTGAFRLYGLAPGSYYVSATPQGGMANGALLTADGPVTYGPTYFPGTTDSGTAQRVQVGAGQEQPNIDFALNATPAVRVSGIVLGPNGAPIQGMLNLRGTGDVPGAEQRARISADGSFTLPSVPAGNYILEFVSRTDAPNAPPQVAAAPVAVAGADIIGLTITASSGATVTGTIAAENRSRIETAGIRVTAPALRTAPGGWTPRNEVTSTGSFQLDGLIGAHTLQLDRLPSGWAVKSITANGTDVTDVPLDFRGTEQLSVRVLLTDRITDIAGTVITDTPARGAGIVVFPDDRAKWRPTSRYLRTARAGDNGQFTFKGLPGDERYLAVALEYVESGEHLDQEFLERIRPLATSFSLAEGEQKRLELTLHPRP